jgi:hypothetical protein
MSETAGPRPGSEPESAAFETARVAVRGGRPPWFVLGFLVVIAALVAVGVGGRGPAEPTGGPPVALDSPGAGPIDASPGATGRSTLVSAPASPGVAPIWTTVPGPIQLLARRHVETLFVHGDVFVAHVTGVFVSLQDAAGRVTAWASVSVPGSAGTRRGSGPEVRFDVELPIPTGLTGRLWVQAIATSADGSQVASLRLEVPEVE